MPPGPSSRAPPPSPGWACRSWSATTSSASSRSRTCARTPSMSADVRVLSTIASSMGVALDNARLFDETKRLLNETDQRAAELAIINGVQQGLASQLDTQAMYDLVGDKIQEIFDAQVVDIAHPRPRGGAHPLPVHDRARRALPQRVDARHRATPPGPRDRQAAAHQRGRHGRGRHHGSVGGHQRGAGTLDPLRAADPGRHHGRGHLAPEPRSRERLQRVGRGAPEHPRGQPQRGPRERAPGRGDAPARRRAGHHQRRPAGSRRAARRAGHVRPGGRQDPADLRRPGGRHRGPGPGDPPVHFRYLDRAREALPGRSASS